jgi:N-acetylmuramoyl-L-alanine amidase
MRAIKYIVVHCTATSQDSKPESIVKYWKERLGWRNPGYHFLIEANGNVVQLQPLDKASNGVRGFNANSIHLSYIGGRDEDDRTPQQKIAMETIVKVLHASYPEAKVQGHRDFPKVAKSCPRFDAIPWAEDLLK